MRPTLLTAVAGAGLLLAACEARVDVKNDSEVSLAGFGRGELKTIARLECPERENRLRRVSAAPDGRQCDYRAEDGAEVRLQLVALNGRPAREVLSPYRAEFKTLVPRREIDEAALDAAVDAAVEGEDVARVRLPGVSVDAGDRGARVEIVGGLTVNADEAGDAVHVSTADDTLDIRTDGESGAEIDVENTDDGQLRATYILAANAPTPSGWRVAAYEARGPAAGPVVIATVKSKSRENDDAFDAMRDLVRRNVGR